LPLGALLTNLKALGVGVDVFPNAEWVVPLKLGAADGCEPKGEGVVELPVLPNENENVDGGVAVGAPAVASTGLFTADGVVPPSVLPNEKVDFAAGFGDEVGVVENGLLVPDPIPNPLPNAGFAAVLDAAVAPNADPPLFTLNVGVAEVPADDCAEAAGLKALKSKVDVEGFEGSVTTVAEEVPNTGVGVEFFVNPKLNLGTGMLPLAVGLI